MTSGDPPKSFHRAVMFGALTVAFRLFNAAICSPVATLTFCRLRDRFKSKLGAERWYIFASGSCVTAASEPLNGSDKSVPAIAINAATTANRVIVILRFLLTVFLMFSSESRFLILSKSMFLTIKRGS